MKRSGPLKRKTPLARGKCQLKRCKLKPMSAKTKALNDANKPMLDAFRAEFPKCMYCGRARATDVHEILSGPLRQKARQHRSCILHLCRKDHEFLQYSRHSLQYAVKFHADPKGADLNEFNAIKGGPPLTMAEIDNETPPF